MATATRHKAAVQSEAKAKAPWTSDKLNKLKLHELLGMALKDAKKQENDPKSVLQMTDTWMDDVNGKCVACLAGSVMRHSCGITTAALDVLHDDHSDMPKWVEAIDCLRVGGIGQALSALGRNYPCNLQSTSAVVEYKKDPEAWWACMYGMLAYLKSIGI